ncbi:MAG: hypothetical protein AVDCRST_MAG22-3592 [uncultured Rubrobacteraceae bacterium]|uniref:Uncharacterized protein n=1 Tax=uncultured Rubrobacteraceae bacterium TaxID=349277 RepID=A0A6J4QAE5_9ACTN|nr:MAG: hypothetical protein AVDCRST_MAG22-3592 [uncultured Rubrobacteraceae bacterium]
MRKATVALAMLAMAAGGCGGNEPSAGEEEPVMTGEETTLSPRELDDEETTGELPEKEPVRRDNETTAR